jgi:type II secretory pathway pseudopilin PulG
MFYQIFKSKKGSVMIESLIAMTLIVVGLLGLFNLMSNSISRNSQAVHKIQAVYLAGEGIEVVKNILDTNYSTGNFNVKEGDNIRLSFFSTTTDTQINFPDVFFDETEKKFYQSNIVGEKTVFKRNITITSDIDKFFVISTVSWEEENGKIFSVSLNDTFYKWRP